MGIQSIARPVFRSLLFTVTNAAWAIPSGILRGANGDAVMYADGCGGGAGGGGGDPTPGGGGGGGGPGFAFNNVQFAVNPSETLAITIGAKGVGGAPGSNGGAAGVTSIVGAYVNLQAAMGGVGVKGANPNGGSGGPVNNGANPGGAGGAGAGAAGALYGMLTQLGGGSTWNIQCRYAAGSAGGALNFNGAVSTSVQGDALTYSAGTGGASGGGGGMGGSGPYGRGGYGGSNGVAGSPATGYGAGGGGGSGNSPGGDGTPGFVRLYWWEYV